MEGKNSDIRVRALQNALRRVIFQNASQDPSCGYGAARTHQRGRKLFFLETQQPYAVVGPIKRNTLGTVPRLLNYDTPKTTKSQIRVDEKLYFHFPRVIAEITRLHRYPSFSQRPEPHAHRTYSSRCASPRTFKIKSRKSIPDPSKHARPSDER